jgi:hypothetical protein
LGEGEEKRKKKKGIYREEKAKEGENIAKGKKGKQKVSEEGRAVGKGRKGEAVRERRRGGERGRR